MNRLLWSYPARRDLYVIAAHYGSIDPDLPNLLLARIEEAPLILLEYSDLGTPIHQTDVRKWRVPQTPFLLLYAWRSGGVEIRRVRHERADWCTS